MTPQVLRMERRFAETLGRVRSRPELSVGETAEHLWVRWEQEEETLDGELLSLPAVGFAVLEDGQLIERGRSVPLGYLPEVEWTPIAEWMTIQIDAPALAATIPTPVRFQMKATSVAQESNVLLTSAKKWRDYAESAPQVRLNALVFAQNADQEVIVRGTPLPPIAGTYFVEQAGVAVVAGWTWSPPVAAEVLARSLRISGDDLALLHADGSWEKIRGEEFVRATRTAVRLSTQERDDEQK
ncbi:hypothetical protein LOC68_02225 [Blastopirellula sp. JC732]|uniref:MoxR-vWA-beta-propeller ternary system domain-containing protein n=1 Tax=Blastopirellula sediminis TaxID=2894196 RepID=A0A9X1MKL2_9BACT|nr:hypothetical protein [Blastopirellula sediminis]MCC9607993.1 hypothetical protein [Blastopirellula sediminis]MCC9627214.1 hypothetical protein [Blastopirellula sediminis]